MARALRYEHYAAMTRVGVDAHRSIRANFEASYFSEAVLIDGELAALGGAIGSRLSPFAFVWAVLAEKAARYPKEIVKQGRRALAELMNDKVELVTTVDVGDEAALRFAAFLGFYTEEFGEGQAAFSHHGRRRLVRYVKTSPDLRVPHGHSHVVRLGYHPMELS
jgi:hypothetical protein